jgi:hypothetical protein
MSAEETYHVKLQRPEIFKKKRETAFANESTHKGSSNPIAHSFFSRHRPAHTQVNHYRQQIIVAANAASYPSANRKSPETGFAKL